MKVVYLLMKWMTPTMTMNLISTMTFSFSERIQKTQAKQAKARQHYFLQGSSGEGSRKEHR